MRKAISFRPLGCDLPPQLLLRRLLSNCFRAFCLSPAGAEGVGARIVSFTATAAGTLTRDIARKTITIRAPEPATCAMLISTSRVVIANPEPVGFYPVRYTTSCTPGSGCGTVFIGPGLTLTVPSGGLIGYAAVYFDVSGASGPGTFIPGEDRVGFLGALLPGTPGCPGLGARVLRTPGGLFRGVQVWGPGTAAAYTACVRRVYYRNLRAAPGLRTEGLRPIAFRADTLPLATGSLGPSTIALPVTVIRGGGPCTPPCAGLAPPEDVDASTPSTAELLAAEPEDTATSPNFPFRGGADGSPVVSVPTSSVVTGPVAPSEFLLGDGHVRLDFFANTDCSSVAPPSTDGQPPPPGPVPGEVTSVLVQQGACNRVPDSDLAYLISCERDGTTGAVTGWGRISFCETGCGFCPTTQRVFAGQCVPQGTVGGATAGSGSFSTYCRDGSIDLDAFTSPPAGQAYVRWIAAAGCADELVHATHMLLGEGICHGIPSDTSPDGMGGGYRIRCSMDGSGVYEASCDRTCASCAIRTPFAPDPSRSDGLSTCMPNDPASGAASARFRCGPSSHNVTLTSGAAGAAGSLGLGAIIAGAAAAAAAGFGGAGGGLPIEL